jgi:hypothetical protein
VTKYSALKAEFYAQNTGIARFMGDIAADFLLRLMVKFGDKGKKMARSLYFSPMSVRISDVRDKCKNSEFLNAK